jgi:hypothetical protein
LIYPGKDVGTAVKGLEDNWLISGPIRATMHLASVWWTLEPQLFTKVTATSYSMGGKNVFGPNFKDHPWVHWALENDRNYAWLYFYASDMCEEYVRRFSHMNRHGIARMLELFEHMPEAIPEGVWTEPTFAAGVEFKE